MIKRLAMAMAVFGFAAAVFVSSTNIVGATKPSEDTDHKVTICHRTNSATNPYVQITVDVSAVDGQGHDDHSQHTGPIATSTSVAQTLKDSHTNWGDIIPPVPGVTAGLNWTAEGQAILHNGCQVPHGGQGGGGVDEHQCPTHHEDEHTANCHPTTGGQGGGGTTTTTGGQGGGVVLGASTGGQGAGVATVPSGGVNAGFGGVSTVSLTALSGLMASVVSVGLGVRRLGKSQL